MIRREIVYSIISNLSEQTYTGGSKNEKAKTGRITFWFRPVLHAMIAKDRRSTQGGISLLLLLF
jgi:hypothetical protein